MKRYQTKLLTDSGSSTTSDRWQGIVRPYSRNDVLKLRGSIKIEYTLAKMGAERLWSLLHAEDYIAALSALTGNQAVQQVKAGLKAIYVSGWQVAADANALGHIYPDLSLYPSDSVPRLVQTINNALQRMDQIDHSKNIDHIYWFAPIVSDAEAGFGGILNVFELMKAMIEAGAAAVHFEDQLSSAKKCGHMGGKVVIPTEEFIKKLIAARLAADITEVPSLILARTDANSAKFIANDVDPRDHPFIIRERTPEGFYGFRGGIEAAIARGLAYAPYADMIWCETSTPDLDEARRFAQGIHAQYPDKLLAYNCSPSFNWKLNLEPPEIAKFQRELGTLGYKFQFVTLSGFHALNHSIFKLAKAYRAMGMAAYADFQETEFSSEKDGYEAVKHQEFVGTGYFDEVASVISSGNVSTLALPESTEETQFKRKNPQRKIKL